MQTSARFATTRRLAVGRRIRAAAASISASAPPYQARASRKICSGVCVGRPFQSGSIALIAHAGSAIMSTAVPERCSKSAERSSSSTNGMTATAASARPASDAPTNAMSGARHGTLSCATRSTKNTAVASGRVEARLRVAADELHAAQRRQRRGAEHGRLADGAVRRHEQERDQRPDRRVRIGLPGHEPQAEPVESSRRTARRPSACPAPGPAGTCRTRRPTASAP